jgi:two-component system, chemotaxis family, chemotaxis protein CheY
MTRFLVVDDSATMRRIIKNNLKTIGFESVVEAEGAQAALAKIATGGVDFVISDWAMPEMTGLDLLRAIRANPAHAKLPVLMVTGNGQEEDIVQAVEAGVNGYVIKPFDPNTLAEKLQQILNEPAERT